MENHQGGHSSFIDTSALVNSRHSQHIIPTADIDSLYARPSNKQNQIGIPLNVPKNVETPSSRNSQTLKNDTVSCCNEYCRKDQTIKSIFYYDGKSYNLALYLLTRHEKTHRKAYVILQMVI